MSTMFAGKPLPGGRAGLGAPGAPLPVNSPALLPPFLKLWRVSRALVLAGLWVWIPLVLLLDGYMLVADGFAGWMMFAYLMFEVLLSVLFHGLVALLFTISSVSARWRKVPWWLLAALILMEGSLAAVFFMVPDADDTSAYSVMEAYGYSAQTTTTVMSALTVAGVVGAVLVLVAAVVDLVMGLEARHDLKSQTTVMLAVAMASRSASFPSAAVGTAPARLWQ